MDFSKIPALWFLLDFLYTILVVFIIARFLYYRNNGEKTFFFTYVVVAAIVFQLCILLVRVPMELGFAIGIFAIFGIIRYRTAPINPREMTYLLVCAGIAAKNGLMIDQLEIYKILLSDLLLVGLIAIMEHLLFKQRTIVKTILYNKLELIHEDMRPKLINDLGVSFGIRNIKKIQVGKIDTFKQTAQIKVFFQDPEGKNFSEGE